MYKKFFVILAVTLLAASTSFYLFPEAKAEDATLALGLSFAACITQFTAVTYFLLSIGSFKKGLKVAYLLLSAGILAYSIVPLMPSLSAFTSVIAENALLATIAFILPYILASFLMYLGLRKFARLLQIHFMLARFWVALPVAVLVTAVAVLVPHPAFDGIDATTSNLIIGLLAWCFSFGAMATAVAWRVRQSIGDSYKLGLSRIAVALGAVSFGAVHEVISKLFFLNSAYTQQVSIWPYFAIGMLFLWSSLSLYEARAHFLSIPKDASYVDIIIALAQKVSKPQDIDKQLDKVRQITVEKGSSQTFTSADKSTLMSVYAYLEDYLTTKEPLRKISKEDLRNSLPDQFLAELQSSKATA